MNGNAEENYKQMKNNDFNGEIIDKVLVLQFLVFSTLALLYMTEDIQNVFEFYRRALKNNGMWIALDVFDVCDRKINLDALKYPKGLWFPNCSWKKNKQIASRAIQLYFENVFYTDYEFYNLRNRIVRRNQVLQFIHLVVSKDCLKLLFIRFFVLMKNFNWSFV